MGAFSTPCDGATFGRDMGQNGPLTQPIALIILLNLLKVKSLMLVLKSRIAALFFVNYCESAAAAIARIIANVVWQSAVAS